MKTKRYRHGTLTCRAYQRAVGNGWEVGFDWGGRNIFLSNFVRGSEANRWYALMNREVRAFNARYKVTGAFPKGLYGKFLGSHLHNRYFAFLDRLFAQHSRAYARAVNKNRNAFQRTMRTQRRSSRGGSTQRFLRAA
jgi:hypothetical protein